jgi:hypothetical protein
VNDCSCPVDTNQRQSHEGELGINGELKVKKKSEGKGQSVGRKPGQRWRWRWDERTKMDQEVMEMRVHLDHIPIPGEQSGAARACKSLQEPARTCTSCATHWRDWRVMLQI